MEVLGWMSVISFSWWWPVLECWSAALIWQDYITDPESEGQEERGGRLTSALCRIMQNHINDCTALGDNPIAEARSCLLG